MSKCIVHECAVRTLIPRPTVRVGWIGKGDEIWADFYDVSWCATLSQALLGVWSLAIEWVAGFNPDVAIPV